MRSIRKIQIGLILAIGCLQSHMLQGEVKVTETEKNLSIEEEKEVSPNEDLMQEHGVLNRILLIYEDIIVRLKQEKEIPSQALFQAASIIKTYISILCVEIPYKTLFAADWGSPTAYPIAKITKTGTQIAYPSPIQRLINVLPKKINIIAIGSEIKNEYFVP